MIAAQNEFPLHTGTLSEFAAARDFFKRSDYNDDALCHALGIKHMGELGDFRWDEFKMETLPARLRWCVQVFLRGQRMDNQESLAVCGDPAFSAFKSLGILRQAKNNPSAVVCPVWLYPVDGFVIASDRTTNPDGGAYTSPQDVVYPAITEGTLRFLQLLPEIRGGEVLDLCGGSGIGALHLARSARSAATADVTERSARFAEFNAGLNGIEIESLCGDLYEPVAGRQFDAITAHPPFIPAVGRSMVFRDGGETGETVTRRIIEGLPAHLRAGGTCAILCVGHDSQEKTFELRVRDWLGEKSNEFDIVFGLEKVMSIEEIAASARKRAETISEEDAKKLCERLRSLGVQRFAYGALFIRRSAEPITERPARIGFTLDGNATDLERLLAWRQHCRAPGFAEWLAQSRPRLSPRLQLTARHVVQDGQLTPVEFVFSIEAGIKSALRPDGWIVPLIARLDGSRSLREVFDAARAADEMPRDFALTNFGDVAQRMIERGFLEVEFPR